MLPTDYTSQDCSIARALEVFGERWTLLIVREATLGTSRFDDFQAQLGIASSTLARRLDGLVNAGILVRHDDPNDGRSGRYELTDGGRRAQPILAALRDWGDAHGLLPPPIRFVHEGCGGEARSVLACEDCGEPLTDRDVRRDEIRPRRRDDARPA